MSHDAKSDTNDSGVKITFRTDGLAAAADSIARELIETFDELDVPEGDDNALNALFDAHRTSPRRSCDEDPKKQQQRRERSRSPPRSSARGLAHRHGDQREFTVPRARDDIGPTSPPSKRYMKTAEKHQRLSDIPAIAARVRFLARDICCDGLEPMKFAQHMLDQLPAGADAQCATEAVQKIIDAVHYFYQARQHYDQLPSTRGDHNDDE